MPKEKRVATGRNVLSRRQKASIDKLKAADVPIEDIAYVIQAKKETINAYIKRKRGRPKTVITDENIAQIKALAGYGLNQDTIAAALGIVRDTLYRLAKEDSRITDAIEEGRALAEGQVSRALYNKATNGDTTAIIWYEKTRTGRTDKSDEVIQAKINTFVTNFFEALRQKLDDETYQRVLTSYVGKKQSSNP